MTEMPPMEPNAEERAKNTTLDVPGHRYCHQKELVVRAINNAYHDGFAAGVQAERQATDRDQINFDEGRRFERAAIVAKVVEILERRARGFASGGHCNALFSGRLVAEELNANAAKVRALADHLSQTDN